MNYDEYIKIEMMLANFSHSELKTRQFLAESSIYGRNIPVTPLHMEAEANLSRFLTCTPSMFKLKQDVRKIVGGGYDCLIRGETGTGKELLAQAIASGKGRPPVSVNCAALTSSLINAELFGYRAGSFSGASKARDGLIKTANKGVLFLDEIGDMPFDQQASLLRVIQEHKVRAVGSDDEEPVHFQLVCATCQDLEAKVGQGLFREDLYYRIQGATTLEIPPLRLRRDDARLIASTYWKGKSDLPMPDEIVVFTDTSPLAGNVRSIFNRIDRYLFDMPIW